MIWFIINQLASIAFKLVLMAFLAIRLTFMEYSIYHIIIRFIFYRDTKPIQWLVNNIVYLWYLGFIVFQIPMVIGLAHQLRLMQFQNKLPEFYAGPITSLFLLGIFYEHFFGKALDKPIIPTRIRNTILKYLYYKK